MSQRKFALIPAYEPGETLVPRVRSLLLRGFAVVVAEAALRWPEALTLGVRTFGPGTPAQSRFGNAVPCGVYRCFTA